MRNIPPLKGDFLFDKHPELSPTNMNYSLCLFLTKLNKKI